MENLSLPNLSLGLILKKISETAKHIKSSDLVLVVIPPDCRWYVESNGQWSTLEYEKNQKFYMTVTNEWFLYHNQLFIYSIGKILEDIKCDFMFMHNYGKFPLSNNGNYYFSLAFKEKFLSEKSLTSLLIADSNKTILAKDNHLSPIDVEKFQNKIFYGAYFEGKEYHPNQKGHEYIANLILNKLQQ